LQPAKRRGFWNTRGGRRWLKRFVSEYLIDLNATQAAIRAGYSENTAEVQGPRLLGNVRVQAAIAEATEQREKRTQITQDYVLSGWFDPSQA
jgi:phage terminase small subunit